MQHAGYREEELVRNRTALMLWGGSEADRRAWALETTSHFQEEGLLEVRQESELEPALAKTRGVVLVPDLLALGAEAQAKVVLCLQREERPKLVLGMSASPAAAWAQGRLRDDLAYRLQRSQVDLSAPGLKEAIEARRRQAAAAKSRPEPRLRQAPKVKRAAEVAGAKARAAVKRPKKPHPAKKKAVRKKAAPKRARGGRR
ncbi:MAG: Fis family transcriptional regulator [Myxococcales bacterium]|nr:Fis family transcriptional regulator [Myxococcales bacterium]